MKDKMGFLTKIRISVTELKNYPKLIKEDLSKALTYALLLSLIVGSIVGITQFAVVSTVENVSKEVLSDSKFRFEMKDGILDFKEPKYKKEQGKAIILIDSTKSMSQYEEVRSLIIHKDISLVFFNDGIITRAEGVEYKAKYTDIPMLPNYIDNEILISAIDTIAPFKYVVFITSIFAIYIMLLLNALMVSLVGVLISKMKNISIKYVDILKISIYAMTVPTILQLIISLGAYNIMIAGVYIAIAMKYIMEEKIV